MSFSSVCSDVCSLYEGINFLCKDRLSPVQGHVSSVHRRL